MGITPDLALPPVPKPGRNCIENEFEAPKHPFKVVNGGPLQPPTAPYGAPQPPELPMAPHRALQPPAACVSLLIYSLPQAEIKGDTQSHRGMTLEGSKERRSDTVYSTTSSASSPS